MNYIRFFFVLHWFVPFVKFGPLPYENHRCAPVKNIIFLFLIVVYGIFKNKSTQLLVNYQGNVLLDIAGQCNLVLMKRLLYS